MLLLNVTQFILNVDEHSSRLKCEVVSATIEDDKSMAYAVAVVYQLPTP